MATAPPRQTGLMARKTQEQLQAEAGGEEGLSRSVGTLSLTALGLGAIVGTGIFVIIGEAIGKSGPAIVLSFVLAGLTCVFSALSYAEMASTMPVSGSAYSYSYATLGEFVAWIIGWDLLIEYGLSVAAVAVGWGQYLSDLLDSLFGFTLPEAISAPPGEGGTVNVTAAFLVLAVTGVLIVGVKESARFNTTMVFLKVGILILFIVLGVLSFTSSNFDDFTPKGVSGVTSGASLIFFAYIGFDAVSTAGGEAKNPGRDLPIAIIGSLVLATILYILVALAAVGLVPAGDLAGADAPLTTALREGSSVGSWAGDLLSLGALIAITSVVLTVLYGQSRIFYSMSRDGLVPRSWSKLSARRTPVRINIGFGIVVALLAAFLPLSELAKLVNVGTLFAFIVVNLGVIYLRRSQPDLERPFRVPFVPVVPLIGTALCVYLISTLELETLIRFAIWLLIGLAVYFLYGRKHSRVQLGDIDDGSGPAGVPVRAVTPGRPGRR